MSGIKLTLAPYKAYALPIQGSGPIILQICSIEEKVKLKDYSYVDNTLIGLNSAGNNDRSLLKIGMNRVEA